MIQKQFIGGKEYFSEVFERSGLVHDKIKAKLEVHDRQQSKLFLNNRNNL